MVSDTRQKQSETGLRIFTIGHSNHDPERFLKLLGLNNIQVLADVRSSPYSRYVVQYNHDNIRYFLEDANIEYQYFGSVLGGKPSDEELYDSDGRVLYGKIAESEWFQDGITHLIQLAHNFTVAIMCSEEDPSHCHRRLLITRVLVDQGVEVLHIRGDGSVHSEGELREAESLEKEKGQLSMFAPEEPDEWKSIR